MKKTILTLLFMYLCSVGYAQKSINAYYDAVELNKYIGKNNDLSTPDKDVYTFDSNKPLPVIKLLKAYYPKLKGKTDKEFAQELATDGQANYNPFIGPYLNAFLTGGDDGSYLASSSGSATKSLLGKVGGIDVTNFARGLSQALIDRANEEINILFFDKFKEFMTKHKEIAVLFPRSKDFIVNTQPYQYAVMLQTFREAYRHDIANIVNQLDDLLYLDRYQKFGEKNPEAFAGLAALASVSQLMDGGNIQDVIKSLGDFKNPSTTKAKNLYASIKLMSILSESIRSKNDGEGWVSSADIFNDIINDEHGLRMYFGLIYKLTGEIKFEVKNSTVEMTKILDDAKDKLDDLRNIFAYYQSLEKKWDIIKDVKDKIDQKEAKGEDILYTEYYSYFDKNLDLIETVLSVDELLKSLSNEIKPVKYLEEGRHYLQALRTGNEIYRNVNEKNYTAALMNALVIYEIVVGKKIDLQFTADEDMMKQYLAAQNIQFSAGKHIEKFKETIVTNYDPTITTGFEEEFEKLKKENYRRIFNDKFLTYASFMAAMVEADSPEAVKNIIRSAALPAGSSSIKKYSSYNISVQSYLGLFYNFDHDKSISQAWNNQWGVSAPVGVSVNFGLGQNGGGALGFMVSILDVGAIVDYELRNNETTTTVMDDMGNVTSTTTETSSTELDYKIELGQIFAPGFYATYSFPRRIPLTLAIGTQYGPGLAQIDDSSGVSNTIVNQPKWRFNAFLAFDIPIFTLVNKPK